MSSVAKNKNGRLLGVIPRLTVILQPYALSRESIQVWCVYHVGRMTVHLGVVAYVRKAVVAAAFGIKDGV